MQDEKVNKNIIRKEVVESKLDYLFELYTKGVPLSNDNLILLNEKGYFKKEIVGEDKSKEVIDKINESSLKHSTEKQKDIDKNIDVLISKDIPNFIDIKDSDQEDEDVVFNGSIEITQKDWLPESTTEHKQDFIDWINHINNYGEVSTKYKKFNLYVQQSKQWLEEQGSDTDYKNAQDLAEYRYEELRRCAENTLYFLDKYVFYKEGDDKSGKIKYVSYPAHKVMAFLNDSGYSVAIAKGRQIAATTTLMACDVKDAVFKRNYFMKFITEDQDKAEEIFEDKLKYVFSELPWWMRPDVANERDNLFRLGYKEQKGDRKGVNSTIRVTPPKRTAIAGGAPQKVKIDEAGNIGILGAMLSNQRPTMLKFNPVTRKLDMKRQLWWWGCVCAGTKVWTNDGRLISIENLKQEDGILGYDGKGVSKEPIDWLKPPFKKACYRITTTGGDFIECSENHPLLWSKVNWRRGGKNIKKTTFKLAKDVKTGDHLMMIDTVGVFGEVSNPHARMLGLMIGDGNYSFNSTPQLSVADEEIKKYVWEYSKEHGFIPKVYKIKKLKNGIGEHWSVGIKGLIEVIKKHKMHGESKDNKRLPFDIDSFDKKSLADLLAGYFDADGNILYAKSKNTIRIVLTSANKEILKQVKFQLSKFGIGSSIIKENRGDGEAKLSKGQKSFIHRLYINNQCDIIKFQKEIKLLCKHKQDAIDNISNITHNKLHGNMRIGEFIMGENGKGVSLVGKELTGLKFKIVKKVEFIGERDVYNLTAGNTNTYIANNFVTANTGGELEKGGKSFETEFMSLLSNWNSGNYSDCTIPVFFNWKFRPGAQQSDYDREKNVAYSKKDETERKKAVTEFHQSWPETLSDVFKSSSKTIIDEELIRAHKKRISEANAKHGRLCKYGWFEPIYDTNIEMDEFSDVPFRIIGANFVPSEDPGDPRVTTTIFMDPVSNWKNRYYQGTDPISTDTGTSNMASAIWDKHLKTISAVMDFRVRDVRVVFLQTLLLGIYYGTDENKKTSMELLESNIGQAYTQYKIGKGFAKEMVVNHELPDYLQNKSAINEGIGIDNKGLRNDSIISRLHELFSAYGERIWVMRVFDQIETFTCVLTATGKAVWGPQNKKYFKDDTLFACVYAYICAELCFPEQLPINMDTTQRKTKIVYELRYDSNWNLKRVPVRKFA